MSLKIVHEGFMEGPMENCCMCRTPTRWWHLSDVALCPACAKKTKRTALPTKQEWVEKERALMGIDWKAKNWN